MGLLHKSVRVFGKLHGSFIELLNAFLQPKLKVAIISYHFEQPCTSGVGTHARQLAMQLVNNGCEVHAFCRSAKRPYVDNKVRIHPMASRVIPIDDAAAQKKMDYFLFESDVIQEYLRESQRRPFDIVHTHGALVKAAFYVKKICNTKWAHTFHAVEKTRTSKLSSTEAGFNDMDSWLESCVDFCDGAIYVSKALEKEGRRFYKTKSSIVIPNGIDVSAFTPVPMEQRNVLFIGRFSKEKGVDFLPDIIREVMEVRKSSVTIISAARVLDDELKKVKEEIEHLSEKYKGRIEFIDKPQTQEELTKRYQACQVYIQPSVYESFGLCIAEAMATGRPGVTFKVGGTTEVVGDTGVVATTRKEFLIKLKKLLSDSKKCAELGKLARTRIERFDWPVVAKDVVGYYRKVLNV